MERQPDFNEAYAELKEHQKNISEAVDAKKIIDELISTSFGGDNESQMKAVQLLKGLATSDDPASNAFMKKLDKWTSGLKKSEKKEPAHIVVTKRGKGISWRMSTGQTGGEPTAPADLNKFFKKMLGNKSFTLEILNEKFDSYTKNELGKLDMTSEDISLQVRDFDGNKTKWLGMNDAASMKTIIAWLKSRMSEAF